MKKSMSIYIVKLLKAKDTHTKSNTFRKTGHFTYMGKSSNYNESLIRNHTSKEEITQYILSDERK